LSAVLFLTIACLASSLQAEKPAQTRREQAVTLAIDGQYEPALEIFLDLVRESPDDPALNYYAGLTYLRLKRLGQAMSYLERAVRLKAGFPQPYVELAKLYLDKKLKTEAAKMVDQGLRRFPKHQPLLSLRQRLDEEER
jgi:predicted Zn-dependent protease